MEESLSRSRESNSFATVTRKCDEGEIRRRRSKAFPVIRPSFESRFFRRGGDTTKPEGIWGMSNPLRSPPSTSFHSIHLTRSKLRPTRRAFLSRDAGVAVVYCSPGAAEAVATAVAATFLYLQSLTKSRSQVCMN